LSDLPGCAHYTHHATDSLFFRTSLAITTPRRNKCSFHFRYLPGLVQFDKTMLAPLRGRQQLLLTTPSRSQTQSACCSLYRNKLRWFNDFEKQRSRKRESARPLVFDTEPTYNRKTSRLLLLHENPVSNHFMSGKGFSELNYMIELSEQTEDSVEASKTARHVAVRTVADANLRSFCVGAQISSMSATHEAWHRCIPLSLLSRSESSSCSQMPLAM
jgi:hypothetical protein